MAMLSVLRVMLADETDTESSVPIAAHWELARDFRGRIAADDEAFLRAVQPQLAGVSAAKSDFPTGTPNQEIPRYLRPVLRERIEAQSIADMDRHAVSNRDRQEADGRVCHTLQWSLAERVSARLAYL